MQLSDFLCLLVGCISGIPWPLKDGQSFLIDSSQEKVFKKIGGGCTSQKFGQLPQISMTSFYF